MLFCRCCRLLLTECASTLHWVHHVMVVYTCGTRVTGLQTFCLSKYKQVFFLLVLWVREQKWRVKRAKKGWSKPERRFWTAVGGGTRLASVGGHCENTIPACATHYFPMHYNEDERLFISAYKFAFYCQDLSLSTALEMSKWVTGSCKLDHQVHVFQTKLPKWAVKAGSRFFYPNKPISDRHVWNHSISCTKVSSLAFSRELFAIIKYDCIHSKGLIKEIINIQNKP